MKLLNYQNLSEEEKNRMCEYVCNQYRWLFIENELREEEQKNKKLQYARNLCNNLSKEKQRQKA